MLRPRVAYGLTLAAALAPCAAARADMDWFAVPSLSVVQRYDDNLFSSATQPEDDRVLQASPSLETGGHSPRLTLRALYAFEDENYAEHSELDNDRARERAALEYRYDATRQTTYNFAGAYARTNRPGELNPDIGVDGGRASADSLSLRPGFSHRFDARAVGTAEYGFARERLLLGPGTDTHTVALGYDYDASRLTTWHAGYGYREFLFDGQADVTAHSLVAGVTRALTPSTTGTVQGGPRFSEGSTDAEGMLMLAHQLEPGSATLTYGRGLSTLVGLSGTVTTETVEAAVVRPVGRDFEVRAAAAWSSSTRETFRAEVRRLNLEGSYRVDPSLSIIGSVQSTEQDGSLDAQADASVHRNLVMLGLVLRAGAGPRIEPKPAGPQPASSREEPEEEP